MQNAEALFNPSDELFATWEEDFDLNDLADSFHEPNPRDLVIAVCSLG